MSITVAKNAGFCRGVRRATEATEKALSERPDAAIFTLGHLIHNRTYRAFLEGRGVRSATLHDLSAYLSENPDTPVHLIVRAHGITREDSATLVRLAAEYPLFSYDDMTCPSVKRIHKIAEENTGEDTLFCLYCIPTHPEAVGIMSYAKGEKIAFSSLQQIEEIDFKGKIPILCAQTTQNLVEFEKIKLFFKKLYTNTIFFDTICKVTQNRQTEAVELARVQDQMIVIGSPDSSNSAKLFDLCRSVCENTVMIEGVRDLPRDLIRDVPSQKIGITAGASTPAEIITEVIKAMENKENFGTMLEESLTTLHTGDTVTGTVYAVTGGEIFLDLGAKFTGVIAKEQITDDASANLSDMFKVGDEVMAFVIRVEDGKGVATLSKKRVDQDRSWLAFKAAYDNGEILEGTVNAVVKGGITMTVGGNRVFVPASQTGIAKDGDMSVLVGTTQKVKLIEFDAQKKKALGSIKVVLNEEKRAKEEAIWATLEVGQNYVGTVKNLTPYGAFVDIGGVDGMVHNSELSWKRIKHPSQVVSVGQKIEVFIKELDAEKKRISLGYKTAAMDTWAQFTEKYQVGDIVPAKIVSLMPFGAFAEVYEDVDGLIHISRISTERIQSPADVLTVGQVVDVKITEIDNENRKLALSIRAILEEQKRAAEEEARAAERAAAEAEAAAEAKRLEEERADMAPYIVGSI